MRVLVTGSREWRHGGIVAAVLDGLYATESCGWGTTTLLPFVVIHGACRTGADSHASWWVNNSPLHPGKNPIRDEMPVMEALYPADWDGFGNAAGPIRNRDMVETGQPDLCIAFGFGKGTDGTVKLAVDAGVPTYRIVKEG